jgi:hypothetical protein
MGLSLFTYKVVSLISRIHPSFSLLPSEDQEKVNTTLLHSVLGEDVEDVIRAINAGAKVQATTPKGLSPLHIAAATDSVCAL